MIRRMAKNGRKSPLVSVVFLTRNPGPKFKKTLEAVVSQKTAWDFEILALDNESADGTWELLEKYQKYQKYHGYHREIRVYRVPRQEFMHGLVRNKAFGMAKGEILVNLVGDAVPVGKSWLATLVAPLLASGKNGRVAGVSGRQVPPEGLPISQEFFLLKSYPGKKRILTGQQRRFGPGNIWFSNVCSAVARWAWERVKFPDMVMSEDQGWATEALKNGWTLVYEPEAKVVHGHKLTLPWLFRRNVDSGASLAGVGAQVSSLGSGKMWEYLGEEIGFAWRKRGLSGVFSIFPYEAVRWLGFQVGYRSFVPWRVKKFFSVVPWWWDAHPY